MHALHQRPPLRSKLVSPPEADKPLADSKFKIVLTDVPEVPVEPLVFYQRPALHGGLNGKKIHSNCS